MCDSSIDEVNSIELSLTESSFALDLDIDSSASEDITSLVTSSSVFPLSEEQLKETFGFELSDSTQLTRSSELNINIEPPFESSPQLSYAPIMPFATPSPRELSSLQSDFKSPILKSGKRTPKPRKTYKAIVEPTKKRTPKSTTKKTPQKSTPSTARSSRSRSRTPTRVPKGKSEDKTTTPKPKGRPKSKSTPSTSASVSGKTLKTLKTPKNSNSTPKRKKINDDVNDRSAKRPKNESSRLTKRSPKSASATAASAHPSDARDDRLNDSTTSSSSSWWRCTLM